MWPINKGRISIIVGSLFFVLLLVAIVYKEPAQEAVFGPALIKLGGQLLDMPGDLVSLTGGPGGVWAFHKGASESSLSYISFEGAVQWSKTYTGEHISVDTTHNFSAVLLGTENKIIVVDAQGLVQWQWQASVDIFAHFINEKGMVLANLRSEVEDVPGKPWGSQLVLLSMDGNLLWDMQLTHARLLKAYWSPHNLTGLLVSITEETLDQCVATYTMDGQVFYERALLDLPLTAISVNPTGQHVAYASEAQVRLLDIYKNETIPLNIEKTVALVTTNEHVFVMTHIPGRLGRVVQTNVLTFDLNGVKLSQHSYEGALQDHALTPEGDLIIATSLGVYQQNAHNLVWRIDVASQPLRVATPMDTSTNIFVYSEKLLTWYR